MKKFLKALIIMTIVFLNYSNLSAQEGDVIVKYKKKTILDLTGMTIEGELDRPEGSFAIVTKISKFSNLITTRGDFRAELGNAHNDL